MIITEREKGLIEGYALALDNIQSALTGYGRSHKSYDPMRVEDDYMLSYAFSMKNGGRKHPLVNYNDIDDILKTLREECLSDIHFDIEINLKQ